MLLEQDIVGIEGEWEGYLPVGLPSRLGCLGRVVSSPAERGPKTNLDHFDLSLTEQVQQKNNAVFISS